jgi:hypothetical protein
MPGARSRGQQGTTAVPSGQLCAPTLTSGRGSEQRRSQGHAVHGMQGIRSKARAPPLDQYLPQDGGRHSHNQEHHACSTHHAKIHIHRGSSLVLERVLWGLIPIDGSSGSVSLNGASRSAEATPTRRACLCTLTQARCDLGQPASPGPRPSKPS